MSWWVSLVYSNNILSGRNSAQDDSQYEHLWEVLSNSEIWREVGTLHAHNALAKMKNTINNINIQDVLHAKREKKATIPSNKGTVNNVIKHWRIVGFEEFRLVWRSKSITVLWYRNLWVRYTGNKSIAKRVALTFFLGSAFALSKARLTRSSWWSLCCSIFSSRNLRRRSFSFAWWLKRYQCLNIGKYVYQYLLFSCLYMSASRFMIKRVFVTIAFAKILHFF